MTKQNNKHNKILGEYTYNQYMYSPEWKAKRESLKEGAACYVCNSTKNLHLHHITYERIGKELPQDLVWLCRHHYRRVHNLVNKHRSKLIDAHHVVKDRFRFKKTKVKNKLDKTGKVKKHKGYGEAKISELVKLIDKRKTIFDNIKEENRRKKELKEERLKLYEESNQL